MAAENKNTRPLLDPATGEPIELYQGELITADNNPSGEEYVHLMFDKPNGDSAGDAKVNVEPVISTSSPVEVASHSVPVLPESQYYQAGYQQIDLPQHQFGNGIAAGGGDEEIDREDVVIGKPMPPKDPLYPLGKPVKRPLAPPPPHHHFKEPSSSSSSGGSFFDFLPDFVKTATGLGTGSSSGGSSKSDREGPVNVLRRQQQQPQRVHTLPTGAVPFVPGPIIQTERPIELRAPDGFPPRPPPPYHERPKEPRIDDLPVRPTTSLQNHVWPNLSFLIFQSSC